MKRYILVITPVEFKNFYKQSKIFNGVIQKFSTLEEAESEKNNYSSDKSIESLKIVDLAVFENLINFLQNELGEEEEQLAWSYYYEFDSDILKEELEYVKSGEMDFEEISWDGKGFKIMLEREEKKEAILGKVLAPIYDEDR